MTGTYGTILMRRMVKSRIPSRMLSLFIHLNKMLYGGERNMWFVKTLLYTREREYEGLICVCVCDRKEKVVVVLLLVESE